MNKFIKPIIEINSLIEANEIDKALEKFKSHIAEIKKIGRFSENIWTSSWRESIYDFGTKFKSRNPINFLNVIKSEKENSNNDKDQCEVLDFYYSEIVYNTLPNETWIIKNNKLIEKYPYNPEFRYNYAHYLLNNKKYKKAIEQYSYALEKDENNANFRSSLFNTYIKYLNHLLEKSKYSEGTKLIEKLLIDKTFVNEPHFNNHLIVFNSRFNDQIVFNKKIKAAKELIKNETQKGQSRIIEILGFFSAIMAFIFSTISIGKNFKFEEAIIFNISLGLTLLIFVLVINLLFSNKKIKINDFRIALIIIFILSLLLIVTKFGIPLWI